MARGKVSGVNKSEEIRQMFIANPKISTKEVMEALNGRGFKVSNNLVYLVKAKMMKKRRRQRREVAEAAGRKAGLQNPVQVIIKVKSLAADVGGLRLLKQLVDALTD